MIFTGDILLLENDGDIDALWSNGQPHMTNGFDTAVLIAIFGDHRTWQNAIVDTDEERIISTFPDIIARAIVSESVKNDGIEALRRALAFLVSSNAASRVDVMGSILSVRAIGWAISIIAPTGRESRYRINWEEGMVHVFNS